MTASLETLQKNQDAVFRDGRTPAHFGDAAAEYRAAAREAALCDLSDWSHLEITGAERAEFLHSFCTNDIRRLKPGEGCEAFLTNIKGRIIGHVLVFAGDESLWLMSPPDGAEGALRHLSKYLLTDEVQLHLRTGAWGVLAVIGPHAPIWLEERMHAPAGGLACFASIRSAIAGVRCIVARCDMTRQPGLLLRVERSHLSLLWQALVEKGLRPAGHDAFEALRIEAGFPRFGIDLTDEHIAQEAARTAQTISFKKGCYLGQEPIARLDALGHVNRELRSLSLEGAAVPERGAPVLDPAGKEIGTVRSAALSYDPPHAVALAMLRTQPAQPGAAVQVRLSEGSCIAARVV